jgi:hypothetical protein
LGVKVIEKTEEKDRGQSKNQEPEDFSVIAMASLADKP